MDMVRRNTDYALRAMVNLAEHYQNQPLSTRKIAAEEDIPYQLACKLMQKLHNAKLVKSFMGPKGGFRLNKDPSSISLLQVIEAIQGPVRLNRCLLGRDVCSQQKRCKVRMKLADLGQSIKRYLGGVTLDELARARSPKQKGQHDRRRKR
ncbi:MAG: RrF2 family transcriptional regulator [Sedimentisphaerales bacterium]